MPPRGLGKGTKMPRNDGTWVAPPSFARRFRCGNADGTDMRTCAGLGDAPPEHEEPRPQLTDRRALAGQGRVWVVRVSLLESENRRLHHPTILDVDRVANGRLSLPGVGTGENGGQVHDERG